MQQVECILQAFSDLEYERRVLLNSLISSSYSSDREVSVLCCQRIHDLGAILFCLADIGFKFQTNISSARLQHWNDSAEGSFTNVWSQAGVDEHLPLQCIRRGRR